MNRADRAARDAILQRVFPDLQYGDDPDIDRYFNLRAQGRVGEALSVYNNGLRTRYPDDSKRIVLLNLYRRRDPRFASYHDDLLWSLYESVSVRLMRNLDSLCNPLIGVPPQNTYKVLKAMEGIVSMLPDGSDGALNFLDSYETYADLLAYRFKELHRVRFLAGEYFAQASDSEPDEADFLARSQEVEERRQVQEKTHVERNFFNLSKINFSPEDLKRIEIPDTLERKEDRVLAFCYKYWLSVGDPGFERIVFLYSRKYGTPHYEVFRAIKLGRSRKFTDDEVLNRVSTALSSRYSYSVQGDIYMQRSWRSLKAKLMGIAMPGAGAQNTESEAITAEIEGTPRKKGKKAEGKRSKKAVRKTKSSLLKRTKTSKTRGLKPIRRTEAIPVLTRGSVSDRIKRLSGRRYDVYREEFLAHVRPAIQRCLSANRSRHKDVFEDPINKAEDIVYEFLAKNYANPFMDWEGSEARRKVEALGFSMPNVDDIIENWYKNR
jgi:hypothetical protein